MRAFACALLLLSTAASTAVASQYGFTAGLGAGAGRRDTWSEDQHRAAPAWDWSADAAISGTPFRRGLLSFMAGANYRQLYRYYEDSSSLSDGLGYRLGLSVFGDSVAPTSFYAGRTHSDFLSSLEPSDPGANVSTSMGANSSLRLPNAPTVHAAIHRNESESHRFESTSRRWTMRESVNASHSNKGHQYSAGYDTSQNGGTYAETNYQSHAAGFDGRVAVSDKVTFGLSERYYLRLPTLSDPFNPRYDDNSFGTNVQWRPTTRVTSGGSYSFRHSLVTLVDAPDREVAGHAANVGTQYLLTETTSVFGSASFAASLQRLGDEQVTGTGETVGAGVGWHRALSPRMTLRLGGSASAGLSQVSGSTDLTGWGAGAGAGLLGSRGRFRGQVDLSTDYSRNLGGIRGWTLSNRAAGRGQYSFGRAIMDGSLTLRDSRRQSGLFGHFEARSLTAALGGRWRRYGTHLSAGLSEGVSTDLANPLDEDVPLLPVTFKSYGRFGSAGASVSFLSGKLALSIVGRTTVNSAPNRPDSWENGASASAALSIGAFRLSLEERHSVGGSGDHWRRANLIMARIHRSFGLRF